MSLINIRGSWLRRVGDPSPPSTGWTTRKPKPLDVSVFPALNAEQPGSRLFFLDPDTGDDDLAEILFWDGTNIINESGSITNAQGELYGTDPLEPNEAAITPYRLWPYIAPRRSPTLDIGTPWDGVSINEQCGGGSLGSFRADYPDWYLTKRGSSTDLQATVLEFIHQTDPTVLESPFSGLSIPGSADPAYPQVFGAYGSLALPRPRYYNYWKTAFVNKGQLPIPRNIVYESIHFDGDGRFGAMAFNFLYQNSDSRGFLVEDCLLDGCKNSQQQGDLHITFRRTLIVDATDGQGYFFSGTPDTVWRSEQCIWMRNGFPKDPKLNWPPAGSQFYYTKDRNMYISGECNHMQSGIFDSLSLYGASGDQYRCGMRVERNFFYQGYVSLGAKGGYPDTRGPTGAVLDNVLQNFKGRDTNQNTGQPGWGYSFGSGAYAVDFARNILSCAQEPVMSNTVLTINALSWYCYSHTFHHPTRNNNVHSNILDNGETWPYEAIKVLEGVFDDDLVCSDWSYPGVLNNTITQNILINKDAIPYRYATFPAAVGTVDTTIMNNNTMYTTRASAALAEGWPFPDRTLKSYMEDLGFTVTSADGYIEFFNEAIQQRKGYWRKEFTGRALVNYFREGFGMPSLGEIE